VVEVERDKQEDVVYKRHGGVETRLLTITDVLSDKEIGDLERALPETWQNYNWVQLYSMKRHGASLKTIFSRCWNHDTTLLLVLDQEGVAFGGFATEQWRDRGEHYFGSGESFLFTFRTGTITKYAWTRHNNYFQLANLRGIAFGGGGHFGLFLDADLSRGSTDWCRTFGSACLSNEKLFEVCHLEIWGFKTPNATEVASRPRAGSLEREHSLTSVIQDEDDVLTAMYMGR